MQIVLGTIKDMGQAMEWLKTTFMYARVSETSSCKALQLHTTLPPTHLACLMVLAMHARTQYKYQHMNSVTF